MNRTKRTATTLILLTGLCSLLFGRNYSLGQEESVNLSGIDRVEFDLRGVNCALCVRKIAVSSELFGNRTGGNMKLALTGRITSNRAQAVPKIIVERNGNTVFIRLYPERRNFFGLSQSGRARFTAHLPSRFTGELTAAGGSGDTSAEAFNLKTMEIRSSSGDITAEDIRAGTIALSVSSGDMLIGSVIGKSTELKLSSGKLRIDSLDSEDTRIDSSSGSIAITSARGGIDLSGGSGKTLIGMESVERPIRIDVSSGSVELKLPPETRFNTRLSTNSGSIRSDFEIIGDAAADKHLVEGRVNGGGPPVEIRVSSGDIELKFR